MILETLRVELIGDTASARRELGSFDRAVDKSERNIGGLERATASYTKVLGLMAGAAGVGFATYKLFELGAAAGETASKFRTVLGPATAEMSAFLDGFATKAGLARVEAEDMAATTAAIAQGFGFADAAAAELSRDVLTLAGDFASFNNLKTADTLTAITAALAGERESMKRLGVVILETDVQKRALAQTGKRLATELTQEEKALATMALITERAGKAVGDLDRTQLSNANQAKALTAEYIDQATTLTTYLQPAFGVLIEQLQDASGSSSELVDDLEFLSGELQTIASVAVAGFRTVANVIQLTFGTVAGVILQLTLLVTQAIEGLVGLANRVPGVDLVSVLSSADVVDVLDQLHGSMTRDIDDIADAWNDVLLVINDVVTRTEDLGDATEDLVAKTEPESVASILAGRPVSGTPLADKSNLLDLGLPDDLFGGSRMREFIGVGEDFRSAAGRIWDAFKGGGSNVLDDFVEGFSGGEFFSNLAAGLATGGISALAGMATNLIGGLIGGGPSEEAIRSQEGLADAMAANRKAVEQLTSAMLGQATVGLPFAEVLTALTMAEDLFAHQDPDDVRSNDGRPFPFRHFLAEAMRALGLSMEDLEAVADALGITLTNVDRDADALRDALEKVNFFSRDLALAQRQFELFDIEDPGERFRSIMDLLAANVTDDFGAILAALTPETFDAFLEMFRAGFGGFDQEQLGTLTMTEFMDAIGLAESALDSLADDAQKAGEALRNVPHGFRVALARFEASDAVAVTPAAFKGLGSKTGVTAAGTVMHVDQLNVYGVQNAKDLMRSVEREATIRHRSGDAFIRTSSQGGA